jgi:hypothetical protein
MRLTRLGDLFPLFSHGVVTNARVAGMQDDLKMTDVQWSAGISLFYGEPILYYTILYEFEADIINNRW